MCETLSESLRGILEIINKGQQMRFRDLAPLFLSKGLSKRKPMKQSTLDPNSEKTGGMSFTDLIQKLNQLKALLQHPDLELNPSIELGDAIDYHFNVTCSNNEYKEKVTMLVSSLPLLLKAIDITQLYYFYTCNYLLTYMTVYYLRYLLDQRFNTEAFSLSLYLLQFSGYVGRNSRVASL